MTDYFRDIWHAMRQSSHDDVSETGVQKVWDQVFADNNNLLFGPHNTDFQLLTLHPEPVQIFRLWQIYLNNVDPLLKVTHTSSLQGRLIEAAGDVTGISPALEAIMFSLYSVSVMSLTADECQATFGSSKEDLLARYQSGCQQALLNCGYLKTGDRECLTAFYLFLVYRCQSNGPGMLANVLRSRSDLVQIPDLYPPCLALRCVLHTALVYTASQPVPNIRPSRQKCAEDFGGRSNSSTPASAS